MRDLREDSPPALVLRDPQSVEGRVVVHIAGAVLREDSPPALMLRESQSAEGRVVAHIAGAVLAPGVYELPAGARIQDAVAAAGGPREGADLDALNLARRMRDGERIEVPGAASEVAGVVATLAPDLKLDLNAATLEQLDQLPGIGEAYSRRIVDSRQVDGPYRAVEDLVARRVIPAATLDKIRDRVTVTAP